MKYGSYLSCMLMLLSMGAFAQVQSSLGGNVKDKDGKQLPAVNIMILNTGDSSLVRADVSDDNGHYQMEVGPGIYIVRYSSMGYVTVMRSDIQVLEGQASTLPDIVLLTSGSELKSVTVTSRKPMIEVKADKIVFNVENSINATGSNGLELLRKSPGVMVDNNEHISMKGKTGVKIYIDGRLSQLDVKSLAAYLKSINSNDIEAIEMISNPGAKYDASGNAGIINIRLKKNKKFGMNGNVSAGIVQGITPKENGSLSLNYRNKKINVFGNTSFNAGRYEDGMNIWRLQKDTVYDQHAVNKSDNTNFNIKAGADYFVNRKSTLGVLATAGFDYSDWRSNSNIAIYYSPEDSFVKTLRAGNSIPTSRTNTNFNLNYRYADTNGTEWNIDVDHGIFRGRGHSLQPNYYYDVNDALIANVTNKNRTPTDIDISTLKIDGERNVGKAKISYGVKASYVTTENTLDFYIVNDTGDALVLDRSNSFKYTENINAAYVSYVQQYDEHWSLQAGLRVEHTASTGELTRADGVVQPDNTVKRSYTDLFPSAALTWNINKIHSLNLTYSRRIDRPGYQDLNPFENKLDELTYEKGNAFLRPQYTSNVELTHTFMGFVNTSVGYSHVTDFATQVTDTIANAGYVQQQNIATQQILSFNIGAPTPIRKWWSGYISFWYSYQMFDGHIGKNALKLEIPLYGGYAQQSFTLGKGYSAEISGWYGGPGLWGGTWKTKAMGSLDAGIQKTLLKDKATIKVGFTDIFKTSGWRSENNFGGVHASGNGFWESQTAKLNFTWRFGNSGVGKSRERKTGLESEASRIKGGK